MRAQSPSGAGCCKALAPYETLGRFRGRDGAPKSSTLGCWAHEGGFTTPFYPCTTAVLFLQGWRAGRQQWVPWPCLCAGLLGR